MRKRRPFSFASGSKNAQPGLPVDMDLNRLRTFMVAAEHRHFGEAAIALGVRAATVSRHVGDLEDELGVLLFERNNCGVRLTRAGNRVLPSVHRTFLELEDVIRSAAEAGEARGGVLRLGILEPPASGTLHHLLADHRRRWPDVQLTLIESHHVELRNRLLDRRLDAAIILDETAGPALATLPLWREHLCAGVPEAHPLASRSAVAWAELARETVLVQAWQDSSVPRELLIGKMGINVRFESHYASQHSVLALVGAGYGVTVVLDMVASASVPGVKFRPIDEADATTGVVVAWAPGLEDALVGRFVSFLRDQVRTMKDRSTT